MLTAETKQRRAVPPAMQASVDAALAAARAEGYKAGHADAVAQANADNTIAPRTYSLQQVHAAVAAARAEAKAEAYKRDTRVAALKVRRSSAPSLRRAASPWQ